MAHFAQIDENNIVIEVLSVEQAEIDSGLLGDPDTWIKTSYNANIRGRFAGIGFTYDAVKDEFIRPKPFPSWALDEDNEWQPPVAQPAATVANKYVHWDEAKQEWNDEGPPTSA